MKVLDLLIKGFSIATILTTTNIHCDWEAYPRQFDGNKEYENENKLDVIDKYMPENPIIFEAGGHYGEDSKVLARRWRNANVITFEPNPNAFEKLCSATINIPTIFSYNLAVNNYNGIAILNVCYGSTGDDPVFEGASSILPAAECMEIHYQGPKVEVPCVILDDWCLSNNVDHIDFMWLDLEGLELQVLESSPKILETVKIIYTETNFFEFRKGTTQYGQLEKFLLKNGFTMVAHWYNKGLQGDALFIRK